MFTNVSRLAVSVKLAHASTWLEAHLSAKWLCLVRCIVPDSRRVHAQVEHVELVTEGVEISLDAITATTPGAPAPHADPSRQLSKVLSVRDSMRERSQTPPVSSTAAATGMGSFFAGGPEGWHDHDDDAGVHAQPPAVPAIEALVDGLAQNAALAELAENPTSLFMLAIDKPPADTAVAGADASVPVDGGAVSAAALPSPSPEPGLRIPSAATALDAEHTTQTLPPHQQPSELQRSRDISDALPPSTTAAAAQTYMFALPPVLEDNPLAAEAVANLEEPCTTAYHSFTSGAHRRRSVSQQRASSAVESKHSHGLEEPTPIDADDLEAPLVAPSHRSSMCGRAPLVRPPAPLPVCAQGWRCHGPLSAHIRTRRAHRLECSCGVVVYTVEQAICVTSPR